MGTPAQSSACCVVAGWGATAQARGPCYLYRPTQVGSGARQTGSVAAGIRGFLSGENTSLNTRRQAGPLSPPSDPFGGPPGHLEGSDCSHRRSYPLVGPAGRLAPCPLLPPPAPCGPSLSSRRGRRPGAERPAAERPRAGGLLKTGRREGCAHPRLVLPRRTRGRLLHRGNERGFRHRNGVCLFRFPGCVESVIWAHALSSFHQTAYSRNSAK